MKVAGLLALLILLAACGKNYSTSPKPAQVYPYTDTYIGQMNSNRMFECSSGYGQGFYLDTSYKTSMSVTHNDSTNLTFEVYYWDMKSTGNCTYIKCPAYYRLDVQKRDDKIYRVEKPGYALPDRQFILVKDSLYIEGGFSESCGTNELGYYFYGKHV
jgi:hypothetical protein